MISVQKGRYREFGRASYWTQGERRMILSDQQLIKDETQARWYAFRQTLPFNAIPRTQANVRIWHHFDTDFTTIPNFYPLPKLLKDQFGDARTGWSRPANEGLLSFQPFEWIHPELVRCTWNAAFSLLRMYQDSLHFWKILEEAKKAPKKHKQAPASLQHTRTAYGRLQLKCSRMNMEGARLCRLITLVSDQSRSGMRTRPLIFECLPIRTVFLKNYSLFL
jgi:hypothetical protein